MKKQRLKKTIDDAIKEATPVSKKKPKCKKDFVPKVVGTNHTNDTFNDNDYLTLRKTTRERAAFRIAEILEDFENLPFYEKLINSRRRDFIINCLVITMNAYKQGKITKNKGAYFTGVVKQKTALQERIKRYKAKHYHTT